ncbi:MAG: hypothetical protein ACXWC4_06420 [Telluria sp.]
MSSEILSKDLITYNPLTETTRKERTSLLGLSVLGVALVKIPLVPERFSAFGIDFSHVNQRRLVELYALVIIYYLVAFGLYALTDFFAWRRQEIITLREYNRHNAERHHSTTPELQALLDEEFKKDRATGLSYRGTRGYWPARFVANLRAIFEFILPIVFGGFCLWVLLSY